MRAKTLQIHWHDRQPIYACHFQPTTTATAGHRLATSGGDGTVRLWRVTPTIDDRPPCVDYLCTLTRHTGAVNVVRFSPRDELLATAGDDGAVLLWRPSSTVTRQFGISEEDAEEDVESWHVVGQLRGTADVYDLAWSPDGLHMITASIDNTARVWSVRDRRCIHTFYGHHHYVQGVAWDPRGEYVATESGDRTVQIFRYKIVQNQFKVLSTIRQTRLPFTTATTTKTTADDRCTSQTDESSTTAKQHYSMYHNETLSSFFRRLAFTADGALLLTPSGLSRTTPEAEPNHVTYISARGQLQRGPVAQLPTLGRPSVAVACSPVLYQRDPAVRPAIFQLPYRLVYAIATQNAVIIYDTQQLEPLCVIAHLHYATLTDITWSADGLHLIMSSTDGYCSLVVFAEGELGIALTAKEAEAAKRSTASEETTQKPTPNRMELDEVCVYIEKPPPILLAGRPKPAPAPTLVFAPAPAAAPILDVEMATETPKKRRRIAPTLLAPLPSL